MRDFRDPVLFKQLAGELRTFEFDEEVKIMEVCGTHTMNIRRYGIHTILPNNLDLLSGPGCPVCVTDNSYIDYAIELARLDDVIIATFGDMMRVPGSYESLEMVHSRGGDVRVVYSPLDSLEIAKDNPDKKVVFLAVGFETTVPTIAATIISAEKLKIDNFYILTGHKLIIPALRSLLSAENNISGFILPGHVSAIIGVNAYREVLEHYNVPGVVTGFEPVDILRGILRLVTAIRDGVFVLANEYRRVVTDEGNLKALELMDEVFEPEDVAWRGLGVIPMSGLKLRKKYAHRDIRNVVDVTPPPPREHPACRCGDVLQGRLKPDECPLFGNLCTPDNPIGPCMVSSEGSCHAYFKYR